MVRCREASGGGRGGTYCPNTSGMVSAEAGLGPFLRSRTVGAFRSFSLPSCESSAMGIDSEANSWARICMVATVMVRQGSRHARRTSCSLLRKDQLLALLDPPNRKAIDLEQFCLANAEATRDLGEGVSLLHDVELGTSRPLVAHPELLAGVDGGVGVDAVQAHESVEVESVPPSDVCERIAAFDDVPDGHLGHAPYVGWIGWLDLDDGTRRRRKPTAHRSPDEIGRDPHGRLGRLRIQCQYSRRR